MRENRSAHFLTPTLLAEPAHTNKRMTLGGTMFLIGVAFVIHVVKQSDCFPEIRPLCVGRTVSCGNWLGGPAPSFSLFLRWSRFSVNGLPAGSGSGRVGALKLGKMLHRIGHGIAVLPQRFGLNPLMKDR